MREALKLHIQEEIGKCQSADGSSLKEVLLVERRIRMDDFPASEPDGNSPWNVDNYLKHEPLSILVISTKNQHDQGALSALFPSEWSKD